MNDITGSFRTGASVVCTLIRPLLGIALRQRDKLNRDVERMAEFSMRTADRAAKGEAILDDPYSLVELVESKYIELRALDDRIERTLQSLSLSSGIAVAAAKKEAHGYLMLATFYSELARAFGRQEAYANNDIDLARIRARGKELQGKADEAWTKRERLEAELSEVYWRVPLLD